jgi:hypothetical protein
MSPLGGDYINSEGEVVNLDGGAPNGRMSPFNGNFISSDGSIKNIDQLGGGGGGGLTKVSHDDTLTGDGTTGDPLGVVGGAEGDAHKIPALTDLDFVTDDIPAGRVLSVDDTSKTPEITNEGLQYRARAVEGVDNQYFGLWSYGDGVAHFGLFEYTQEDTPRMRGLQDWFDGSNWVSNQYLVKHGITGPWVGSAEYTGLVFETSETDITVDQQPEMDLVDVDTKATQGLSELSLNRSTRQEIADFVGIKEHLLSGLQGQSLVSIINKIVEFLEILPVIPVPDGYRRVATKEITEISVSFGVSGTWSNVDQSVIETTGIFFRTRAEGNFILNFSGNADISNQTEYLKLVPFNMNDGSTIGPEWGALNIDGSASQIITYMPNQINTNYDEQIFYYTTNSIIFSPPMKMEIYYKP